MELGLLLHKSLAEVLEFSPLEVALWIGHLNRKNKEQERERSEAEMVAKLNRR